jgi:hypothetical protein
VGQPDRYPFVISAPAAAKLQYIHDLTHGKLPKRADAPTPPPASSQDASEQALRHSAKRAWSGMSGMVRLGWQARHRGVLESASTWEGC